MVSTINTADDPTILALRRELQSGSLLVASERIVEVDGTPVSALRLDGIRDTWRTKPYLEVQVSSLSAWQRLRSDIATALDRLDGQGAPP